ncbi:MBL fold metallo-hydrolase [Candidatus Dependentiae bacterium]|nr:MBL fold metallo-hydrolase [Candidatus Dependentiae bacterium]
MKKQFFRKNYLYLKDDLTPFKRLKEFAYTAWVIKKEWLLYKNSKRYFSNINPKDWFIEKKIEIFSEIENKNIYITWIGHATFLIRIGNKNILIDPNFSDSIFLCPRNFRPGIELSNLPKIDYVIVSHNHADHLDFKSIISIQKHNPKIFVPLGDKRFFNKLQIQNVCENDWWQENIIDANLKITFLPAIHWSGRSFFDVNRSLWGSWLIEYNDFKIYFAGDTAYANHFLDISKKFGSIDVALLPIAPEEPRNIISNSHMGSEQAVQSFLDLDAKYFIPIHWGTFRSSADDFYGPILKLRTMWFEKINELTSKKLFIPKIGENILLKKTQKIPML